MDDTGEIFKRKAVVRGLTGFMGNAEFNESYSAFVDISLSAGGKESQGFGKRTEARKCIDKGVIERVKHVPLPFVAELSLVERASKSKTSLVCVDIKPLAMIVETERPITNPAKAA